MLLFQANSSSKSTIEGFIKMYKKYRVLPICMSKISGSIRGELKCQCLWTLIHLVLSSLVNFFIDLIFIISKMIDIVGPVAANYSNSLYRTSIFLSPTFFRNLEKILQDMFKLVVKMFVWNSSLFWQSLCFCGTF